MATLQGRMDEEWSQAIAQEHIETARRFGAASLDLIALHLTHLPESLGQLTQLQTLSLHLNHLRTLPEWLGQLTQLRHLSLLRNQITALPECLGRLTQLEHLNLSENQLTALPESLGELTQLRQLFLDHNQLVALPESLRKLASLEELYLHGNDALGLPAEVLGPALQDVGPGKASPAKPAQILDYYFRVRERIRVGSRPLNEAKLILLGRGLAGKTSIVNRLVYNRFDPREPQTEGIRVTQWGVTLNANEDVRLNIWDFGGQEIMHSTHLFFLTQRSLYLLVLQGRDGLEDTDAEYWLQLIESFGGESPVIVVLNKIKERPFDLNRRALKEKYTSIRSFVKTDCADETGLAELRAAIRRETDQLEGLREKLPASWFAIKDRLAGMVERKENYLSFEHYRRLCQQLGEPDRAAQEYLAATLHSLGVALNFRGDRRLDDTHVLNPHWLTNGIYKILNAKGLENDKGVFRMESLTDFFDTSEYPPSTHLFLLDLMKKFELCFEFLDDREHHYLVPELLDKQEPDMKGEFQPEQCLNFQYHYNVMPEGLLPRFIVRTHILSPANLRWRTGVVLEFEGNRAVVKSDARDRKVTISVTGPPEGRRRLLAVIRSDFEAIHRDMKKLQVEEMVPVKGRPEAVVPYDDLKVLEKGGVATLHQVIRETVVELDVEQMLNGVDLEGTRQREGVDE
jgi:internalin A